MLTALNDAYWRCGDEGGYIIVLKEAIIMFLLCNHKGTMWRIRRAPVMHLPRKGRNIHYTTVHSGTKAFWDELLSSYDTAQRTTFLSLCYLRLRKHIPRDVAVQLIFKRWVWPSRFDATIWKE